VEPLHDGDPDQVGGYRLLARLGAGGMGVVYLGRSPAGRAVAVKVIRPRFAGDLEFRVRFRREAAVARTVTGAFTAAVLDAQPDATEPWLVTAYLPGLTLREAVSPFGALPQDSVRTLAAGLAEALTDLHRAGLVHRDLKPGNVVLTAAGPKVIDFGIARIEDATAITRVGTVLGTPGYLAPERVHGEQAGPASDVFALGAVLAFAATGRDPFGRGDTDAVLARVAAAGADLAGIGDRVLLGVIAACLRVAPQDRPTAAALLDRLAPPADGPPVAGWLPAPVAQAIDHRTAYVREVLAPTGTTLLPPAPVTSMAGEATLTPSQPLPVRPPGVVRRRSMLAGGAALLLAGAGTAAAVVLTEDDEPTAPAAPTPSSTPTRPRGPERAWLVRVADNLITVHTVGGVVLASAEGGGIRALDPRTGGLVWQRDGDSVVDTTADTAYLVNRRGWRVTAVDAATGTPRWTYDPPLGEVSRNAVAAGDVVCFGTGAVRAIGAADGRSRWTAPVAAERGFVATGGVLVCATLYEVNGIDAATGQRRWRIEVPQQPADPRAGDGAAYVCDATGTIRAVRVADGTVLWQRPGMGSTGPPWVAADTGAMYYSADGEVRAHDAATGAPKWTFQVGRRTGAADVYSLVDKSTITLVDDTLYVASNEAHLHVLNAADGRVRWDRADMPGVWRLAAADGLVFVGTADGQVEAIRPPDGG
jgi:outer membrane protein assembly factor BamB